MATQTYKCQTCGALAAEPGHLCNPAVEVADCPYCGVKVPHVKHYCKGKMEDLKYVCEKCGRLAPSKDLLCQGMEVPTV